MLDFAGCPFVQQGAQVELGVFFFFCSGLVESISFSSHGLLNVLSIFVSMEGLQV